MQKMLVILGPTATGKSSLGVLLAKKYNGEIISADSRQIYKGLEIGTGAVTKKEMQGIPHHLLSIVDAKDDFSVAEYKTLADEIVEEILSRGKLPIIVGGTGFYIQSVVDNVIPPEVPPNKELRAKLEQKKKAELLEQLQRLDPDRAETVEPENKRRLIRAIEIATTLGSVPKTPKPNPKYNAVQIGLDLPDKKLRENIQQRVRERLENGWIKEVEKLLSADVSKKHLREFGLGYTIISDTLLQHSNILQNVRMSELEERITTSEWQYAKQQRKWFRRDSRIKWFEPTETEKIEKEVEKFLE